jgi:hypothetical protein
MPISRRPRAGRAAPAAGGAEPEGSVAWRAHLAPLAIVFVLSAAVRVPGVYTLGMGLDGPGTWQIINYDEANSCEGALGTVPYPSLVGRHVIALGRAFGTPPPAELPSPEEVRAIRIAHETTGTTEARALFGIQFTRASKYCEGRAMILLQRYYSVVTGALSVVLLGVLALMMFPQEPRIAWTACVLLGWSNLHVAHSHMATLDVPQIFYLLLLTVTLCYAVTSQKRWPIIASLLPLAWAVLTKWYVFAVFAYACVVPRASLRNWRRWILPAAVLILIAAVALILQWETARMTLMQRWYLVWGSESGRFGTDYGHIGAWRRWIRNVTNLPIVFGVGLGVPATCFAVYGLYRLRRSGDARQLWLAHAPAAVYLVYMIVLGPVTYYRHYLPLFPTVALLSAYGFWRTSWSGRRWVLGLFLVYPLLLTADSELGYWNDPRIPLRGFYAEHPRAAIMFSFYTNAAPRWSHPKDRFNVDGYAQLGRKHVQSYDFVVLAEPWYTTAFANELNGPIAWNPDWLIKTTGEYATIHRRILAGEDPNFEFVTEYNLEHFMPELQLHDLLYGSFEMFLGDLKIYRVTSG